METPTSVPPTLTSTFDDLAALFPEMDEVMLLDMAKSVMSGTCTRREVVDMLYEIRTTQEVHTATAIPIKECTIYVTYVGGIRKVRDDCRRLKQLFDTLKIKYNEIDVAENRWLRSKIATASGMDTLPLVFIEEDYVGMYDDLEQLNDEGLLMEKLRSLGYNA
eukprot:TRINITY_DN41875_c0_g1_i1.p1 TRINITY_DN41875_c0_g1~~TRINITY_DN41875_c0_g1_i1.p1  ORF type:complete len:179 (+),score=53.40 TRINITY_DN41875_c0_g1_i1:51-539(+)